MCWEKSLSKGRGKDRSNEYLSIYLTVYLPIYLSLNVSNEWCRSTGSAPPNQWPSRRREWDELPPHPKPIPTWCPVVWNIPLASWSQLSCFCSLPAPWALRCEWPWLCTALLISNCKHQSVINGVLLLELKHSIIPDTLKKKSTPAETNTLVKWTVSTTSGFRVSDSSNHRTA